MSEPLISLVITAYNAERYISETLDSVRSQTFPDFETLVVDDGSADATACIVEGYAGVRCIRQNNRGQPAARNSGIRAARGAFIAFLDADDLWLPSKLEKQVSYLNAHSQQPWVYSDAFVFDSTTREVICRVGQRTVLYEGAVLPRLLLSSFIPSATLVVQRRVFEEVGLFDESIDRRIGEDWNMWLRIAERYELGLVPEPLASIRQHSQNMTRTIDPLVGFRSKRAIVDDAVARNAAALSHLRPRAVANLQIAAAQHYFRNRDRKGARRMLAAAIQQNPGSLKAYGYLSATFLPLAPLLSFRDWTGELCRRGGEMAVSQPGKKG